jgi:hypothetical protein
MITTSPSFRRSASLASLMMLGLVLQPVSAEGQGTEGMSGDAAREAFLVAPVRIFTAPATGMTIPGALGAGQGDVFAGFSFQGRTRFSESSDGAVVAGFGLGNPARFAALEVAFTSFSTFRSGFFERSHASFKLHRQVGDGWAGAIGWENALTLSGGGGDGGSSLFAVGMRTVRLGEADSRFSSMTFTAGVGDGRFRSEDDVLADRSTAGVFGGMSLRILPQLSALVDWTGQDLAAGISVAPLPRFPLVVNAGFADLTGQAGDGARFMMSGGIGTNVRVHF